MSNDAGNAIDEAEENVDFSTPFDSAGRKRSILYFLIGYAACMGVVAAFLPMIVGLPLLLGFVYWCDVDAQERGMRLGKIMRLSLVLLFAIAFPIYAFRSRGLAGIVLLIRALLFGAVLVVAFAAAFGAVDFVVNGTGADVGVEFSQEIR